MAMTNDGILHDAMLGVDPNLAQKIDETTLTKWVTECCRKLSERVGGTITVTTTLSTDADGVAAIPVDCIKILRVEYGDEKMSMANMNDIFDFTDIDE